MASAKGILNLIGRKNGHSQLRIFRLSAGVGPTRNFSNGRSFSSQAPSSASGTSSDFGDSNVNPVPPADAEVDSKVKQVSAEGKDEIGGEKSSISKAMHAYLKRAKETQEIMTKLEKEFVFGRRHLANMMGKDPETFTQKDIDEAIRYLFPSGLYEPRARPLMRPPTEVYPKQKSAQFDMSGRPHHPFFYTAKPNYYYLLHEMVGKLNAMNKLAPSVSTPNLSEDNTLAGYVWLSKEELENRLIEKITDQMYEEWITCFERIAGHPKRDKELEFINAYRKPLQKQAKSDDLPPVTLEPDGRKSVHVPFSMKKTARADVLVTLPGTGKFNINGKGLEYFTTMQSREAIISPLQLVGMLGKVDVEANVEGANLFQEHQAHPGETAKAIAIRWGIATGLAALGADIEKLRLAGYLTVDIRRRERQKPGQDGARAKWTWKKR